MTIVDRRYSVAEGQAVKAPCRAATTANITLSGEQTIDGIAVVENDRVLVKNQSTASQNGIYAVSTGSWTRTRDFDGSYDVVSGTRVYVAEGTVSGSIEYVVATADPITIDSTSITFTSIGAATVAAAATAVAAASAASASQTAAASSASSASSSAATAVAAAASVAIASVADRTAMKALDTTTSKSALLRESGREGTFVWTAGNFAALITADAQEGIYVKANAIASSAGAWVRVRDDDKINVSWFGSAGYTAAAAALSLAGTLGRGTVVFADTSYDLTSNTLTVPTGINVLCAPTTTILRSADPASPTTTYNLYTGSMIVMSDYCRWSGGIFNNTVVTTTSTTSVTVSAGSKTWTVGTGLSITVGTTFMLAYSRSNPANKLEGIVTAYNSGTGSLTIAAPFPGGSGTWTDWNFNYGAIFHSPMVMHNVTGCLVEDVRVTGHWYVGITMEAWNAPGPSTLQVSNCVIRRCSAESVQNRGFYIYGNSKGLLIEDCFVNGGNGITDYGINMNSANASGNANNQLDTRIESCITEGTSAQGITAGDAALYTIIYGCTVRSTTGASGVGILIQANVVGIPQYVTVIGCTVHDCPAYGILFSAALYGSAVGCKFVACGIGVLIAPSAGVQSQYISINGCAAISNTGVGFNIAGNSNRCALNDIAAFTNGTNGVQIDAGATRTLVTGQSNGNSSNQLVDNGTNSVTSGLTVA